MTSDLRCPRCGQMDMVQKVSGLYGSGREDLAPPVKPDIEELIKRPDTIGWWISACGMFGGITYLFHHSELISGISVIAFFVGIILHFVELDKRRQDARKHLIPKWETAAEKWNRLYYCGREDIVFIPGQGVSVPAGTMETFLYLLPSFMG